MKTDFGAGLPNAFLTGDIIQIDNALIEAIPTGVYVCDARGRIVRFNERAAAIWGRRPALNDPAERFCGSHRLYLPDGSLLPHDKAPMADALRTGASAHDLEVIVERPDGSRVWALVNINPVRRPDGVVVGAVNCFQDITARRVTEELHRRRAEYLETILNVTPEAIKVVARDETLLQMNPAGMRKLGATNGRSVIGTKLPDLIAPEHRERWREHHRRVCDGESLTWEFDIHALTGERLHMETHAVPLTMPDGAVAHLGVTRDITHRVQYEKELREGQRRLSSLLEALPTAVYTTDDSGAITYFNEAAVEFWGMRPTIGETMWCGSWKLFWPNGKPMPHDECPMAVALRENRPIRNQQAIAERPDGTRVPFVSYPTPLHDSDGNLVGAVNMLVDISHHKRAEERQQLLINELNHRVKNTLATVQSIAMQTMRHAHSPEAFRDSFEARLIALSRAHDLLTQSHWESAQLRHVLLSELKPFIADELSRVKIEGEDVALPPRMALTLALAFHELTTNAAKYGALSTDSGTVGVQWQIHPAGKVAPQRISLLWVESGGPPVVVPTKRGFGSQLLERSLRYELRGETRLEFTSPGLRCHIEVPLQPEQN